MGRYLPHFSFVFFLLCCALTPDNTLYTHYLSDPDDYMRLNEVTSWLQGQSWYDLSVPRLSPGAGTIIHWSRLIDIPIALVALPFIKTMGVTDATMLAALVVPFLWLAVFMTLSYFSMRLFAGKTAAALGSLFIFFAPVVMFNFKPGRVDHHGVQAIIAGFGLLALVRLLLPGKAELFAFLSALTFTCGFWIGTEALPWCILFITCLSIAAAWQGGKTAREAALFGLFLPLFTTALIPIALSPVEFTSRALSWFSPAYAIFAALAGLVLIIGWGVGRLIRGRGARLALYTLCGISAAVAFFILIPSAWQGPFADYDTFDATTALDNIGEAVPLSKMFRINRFMPITFIAPLRLFASLLALPLMALAATLFAATRARGAWRLAWLSQAAFLGAALCLTIFWQNRVSIFLETFMLTPLAWLLAYVYRLLPHYLDNRRLFAAEIAVFLLLGPVPVYGLPYLVDRLHTHTHPLPTPCSAAFDPTLRATLNDDALGPLPHTIMNISDIGPELLFETPNNVVAGNFDVPGNADAFTFFHALDDRDAQQAARRWKADLVLMCRVAPTLYLGKDYYAPARTNLRPGNDGQLHMMNTDAHQPLIERLVRGEIPDWLKPIEISGGSDYLLFRIQDQAGTQ